MTGPEMYAKHLAEVANGTELSKAMQRVMFPSTATAEDLFAVIKWELWECIFSLPPMSAEKGETTNTGEPTKITDAWHASACASRAEAMLWQLRKLVAPATRDKEPTK